MYFNSVLNYSVLPLSCLRRQYKWLNLMRGNAWPKLLEVSYGKAPQHNKGLYSYRVKYRTHS